MEKGKLEEIKKQLNELNEAFEIACEELGVLKISINGNTIFESTKK